MPIVCFCDAFLHAPAAVYKLNGHNLSAFVTVIFKRVSNILLFSSVLPWNTTKTKIVWFSHFQS